MNKLSAFDLSGKTALVTGCDKGIGRAMAVALSLAGADIIGVSRSLPVEGSEIANEVERACERFQAYQADFADRVSLYYLRQ